MPSAPKLTNSLPWEGPRLCHSPSHFHPRRSGLRAPGFSFQGETTLPRAKRSHLKSSRPSWRKPRAKEGRSGQDVSSRPSTPPDFGGSKSRGSSSGRPPHPTGGHFLFRGLRNPGPVKRHAMRADWPQGFPPDSVIRLRRAANLEHGTRRP